jgi:putative ABC transport system permease protein
MVLVMLSTTISMYAGISGTIQRQYYHQMTLSAYYGESEENTPIAFDDLKKMVEQAAEKYDVTVSYTEQQRYLSCAVFRTGDAFLKNRNNMLLNSGVCEAWFMTEEEYERLTGQKLSLKENEMVYYAMSGNESDFPDTLTLGDKTWSCLPDLTEYPVSMEGYAIVDCFGFVVPTESDLQEIYDLQKEAYGENASEISDKLALDFAEENRMEKVYQKFSANLQKRIRSFVEEIPDADGSCWMSIDSKWETAEYLYGMYGTFLFLGLLLSVIFIFATALIIYYKQISEGYEDQERFWIMQKVGMSQAEVKGTIRSQILLVFFLPLLVAAIHMAFAFPMLTKLLRGLFQANQMLFLECSVAALVVFAVLYVVIYRVTARTYYTIVKRK